ncbi:MAG: hypothetical protein ABIV25_11760 [Paracoccaceae bacterium]
MSDPNLTDFRGRVTRIQKAHAKGYGFEAPGTLGRSHYHHPQTKRRSIVGPILFLLICAFLTKGAIYHEVGAESYNSRAAALMAGQGFDRIGGWLMQADPVTLYVSGKIELALSKLK